MHLDELGRRGQVGIGDLEPGQQAVLLLQPFQRAPGDLVARWRQGDQQAAAAWNSVDSSDLRVAFGGLESPKQVENSPGGDVVFVDLPPGLLGGPLRSSESCHPS